MTTIKEKAQDLVRVDRRDGKLALAHIYVAFIALFIGGFVDYYKSLSVQVNLHSLGGLAIIKY